MRCSYYYHTIKYYSLLCYNCDNLLSNDMKGSNVIHLVVLTLSIYHTLSADGCGGARVRCGDECTGEYGSCTCGNDAEKFDYRDNTSWCCNASSCEKTGADIVCKRGTLLPLTTPCQGECNTGRSYFAARQYWGCDSRDQCIKIQYLEDGVQHCRDRSDERKINQNLYSPIQWDKLTPCLVNDDEKKPGVACSGQGLYNNCLDYHAWCNERTVMKCSELGGLTSVHTQVCSNNTFWAPRTCRTEFWNEDEKILVSYEGRRCSSEYSGQCYFPHSNHWYFTKTCRDRSHDIQPLPSNGSCPSTFFSCLVEKRESCLSPHLVCDIHPQCDSGEDEKSCKHVYKIKRLTKLSGTRTCHHLHYGPDNVINKPEVEILALTCDGVPECAGGVDEMCDPLLTRAQLCKY